MWHRTTHENSFPGLPCPSCASGKLKLIKDGLNVIEPKYSSDFQRRELYDVVERWSATLRCDENACGEIVQMIGDTEVVEFEFERSDGQPDWGLTRVLRIQAVFPAPPLFRISKNVPRKVEEQLQLAFRMYWTDESACVARLRTAVEALLDYQKVPKEQKTKNGKMRRLNLKERIDAFAIGASHQDQLQGLRNIGNFGTHGGDDVIDEDLFDAIDVLESVLTGIYDTQSINAKAKKLADKRPRT